MLYELVPTEEPSASSLRHPRPPSPARWRPGGRVAAVAAPATATVTVALLGWASLSSSGGLALTGFGGSGRSIAAGSGSTSSRPLSWLEDTVVLDVEDSRGPLTLRALQGQWRQESHAKEEDAERPAERERVLTVGASGRVLVDGRREGSEWDLVQDPNHTIFTQQQRQGGWHLDMERSSLDVLVWRRFDGESVLWYREARSLYKEKDIALSAISLAKNSDPCNEIEITCEGLHIVQVKLSRSTLINGVDVAKFSRIKRLRRLDLSFTGASGDVASLAGLAALTELDLRGSKVSGDIAALGALERLEVLRLGRSDTWSGLYGDIGALRRLTRLRELVVTGSDRIEGGLSTLEPLERLEVLALAETSVEGDLVALTKLRRLRHVGLASTNVMGNVRPLGGLPALEAIDLSGVKRKVDIKRGRLVNIPKPFSAEVFSEELGVSFDWHSLTVEGFESDDAVEAGWEEEDRLLAVNAGPVHTFDHVLMELSRVTEKSELPIIFTLERGVFGNVASLSNATKLRRLLLGGTIVKGNIGSLAGLKNLTDLELWGTRVAGS